MFFNMKVLNQLHIKIESGNNNLKFLLNHPFLYTFVLRPVSNGFHLLLPFLGLKPNLCFSNLDSKCGNRMSCTLFGSNRFSPFHNHKTKDLFQNWKQSDTARLFENHGYKNKKTSKWILLLKKLIIFNIRGGYCRKFIISLQKI